MGALLNDTEVSAGLLRNSASTLSRGLMHYWMDVGGGWFNDERIQRGIAADKAMLERGYARPHRETEHAIAVVYDDDSPLQENLTRGFQHLAILRSKQVVAARKAGNQVHYRLRDAVLSQVRELLKRYFYRQLDETRTLLGQMEAEAPRRRRS